MKRCHDCGKERRMLHRHHIIAKSEGGSDDPSNRVEICGNCHEDRHGGPFGPDVRARKSRTPEARARFGKASKERWANPEWREKMHQTRLASWAKRKADGVRPSGALDPELRAAHPEWQQAAADGSREFFSDPENRERVARKISRKRREEPELWASRWPVKKGPTQPSLLDEA